MTENMDFTETDLELGQVYWSILVKMANEQQGATVRYGDLIAFAQQAHPNNDSCKNAIPISIGRRLDVVKWFCKTNALPDLACLAVGKNGLPGERYLRHTDWHQAMKEVRALDWSTVELPFSDAIAAQRKSIVPRKKRNELEALNLRWEHYVANKARYPVPFSEEAKSMFLTLLMEGLDAEDAFGEALAAQD